MNDSRAPNDRIISPLVAFVDSMDRSVPGSMIGRWLREHEFDYQALGYPSLSAFLKTVPGLVVVGRSGADLLWELNRDADAPGRDTDSPKRVDLNQQASLPSRTALRRLRLTNFKSWQDLDLHFDSPLTVLIGPNASGKTSVLHAVRLIDALREKAPEDLFAQDDPEDPRFLVHSGSGGPLRLVLSTEDAEIDLTAMEFGSSTPPDYPLLSLGVQFKGNQDAEDMTYRFPFDDDEQASQKLLLNKRRVDRSLGRTMNLQLDVRKLRRPSPLLENMAPDGAGLAAALASLAASDPERKEEILELVGTVVPITAVRMPVVELSDPKSKSQSYAYSLEAKVHKKWIPAHLLSEGSLLALGIITALVTVPDLHVLLVDDLDYGLHPRAQAELVKVLRSITEHRPMLRVIATSHSPYLVDALEEPEVRVLRNVDGRSAMGRLKDHPDAAQWLKDLGPGVFWSHVGEDWVGAPEQTTTGEEPK